MNREARQMRSIASEFRTVRENDNDLFIEGYFAVFDKDYNIFDGATESVAFGAFDEIAGKDVKALIDHETRLVLGRTTAGTLEIRQDNYGLWGKIRINPKDVDAMNLYARVERGDVDQCSFGFDILDESTTYREDGSIHWTINKVELYEVSVVTFPAYSETSVKARAKDLADIEERKREIWRNEMMLKLKGEN